MSATLLTPQEAEESKIELIKNSKGKGVLHDVIVALHANRRSGTAVTKTKGTVVYSGAKPWRQKGTGRARAGYKSSPIWTGGGVAHGPKLRDYSKKTPKRMKRLALRKALSSRILEQVVYITDSFRVEEPRTKKFLAILEEMNLKDEKVLIVGDSFDETTFKAARNVEKALLFPAKDVNAEHLLTFHKILITRSGLAILAERLLKQ